MTGVCPASVWSLNLLIGRLPHLIDCPTWLICCNHWELTNKGQITTRSSYYINPYNIDKYASIILVCVFGKGPLQ